MQKAIKPLFRAKETFVLSFLAFSFFYTSCAPICAAGEKIVVSTTIAPYKEFIEAVGGNLVEADFLIPPGANPHTYELTPAKLKQINRAKLYVKVGSGIEFELGWIDKLTALNKKMPVCDSSQNIGLLSFAEEPQSPAHKHNKDPHIWLSPKNAKVIVNNIKEALISIDHANKNTYESNTKNYFSLLEKLDTAIKNKLSGLKNREFVVFHPDWGYFARDYDLKEISVESEGKEPSPKQIAQIIKRAASSGIKTIFVSPQINPKSAALIAAELKGKIEYADPLGEHYIDNLLKFAQLLSQSYE